MNNDKPQNNKKDNMCYLLINKFSNFLLVKFFWIWGILKTKIPEKYSVKVDEKIEKFKNWDIKKQQYTALGVFSCLVVLCYMTFSGDESYEPKVAEEKPLTMEQLQEKIQKEQKAKETAEWKVVIDGFKKMPLSTQLENAEQIAQKAPFLHIENGEEQVIAIVKKSIDEARDPKDLMALSKSVLESDYIREKYKLPIEESAVLFVKAIKNDPTGQFLNTPLPKRKIETRPSVGIKRKIGAQEDVQKAPELFTEAQIKELALLGHVEASEKYGNTLMSKNPSEAADFYAQRVKAGETKYLSELIKLTSEPVAKKFFAENMENPEVKKIIESGHRNGSIILLNCELEKGDKTAYIKYANDILLVSSSKFPNVAGDDEEKNIKYMRENRASAPDEYHTKTIDALLEMALAGNADAIKILGKYFGFVSYPVAHIFYEDIEKLALLRFYQTSTNTDEKKISDNFVKIINNILSKKKLLSVKDYLSIKEVNKKFEIIRNVDELLYIPSEKYLGLYMDVLNKYKDPKTNDINTCIFINSAIYNSSFLSQEYRNKARDFIIDTYFKSDFTFKSFSDNYQNFFKIRGDKLSSLRDSSYTRYVPYVNRPGVVNTLDNFAEKYKAVDFISFVTKEKAFFDKKVTENNIPALYALVLAVTDKEKAKEYFLKLINNTNDIAALDSVLYLAGEKSLGWLFNGIYSDLQNAKYTPKNDIERDLLEYTCALNFAYAKTTESVKRLEFKDKKLSDVQFNNKISSSYERLLTKFGNYNGLGDNQIDPCGFSKSIDSFKDLYKGDFLARIAEYQINNFFYNILQVDILSSDNGKGKSKQISDFFDSIKKYDNPYVYYEVAFKFHELAVFVQKNKNPLVKTLLLNSLPDVKSLDDVSISLAKKALEKADKNLKEKINAFLEKIN